ncbi:MAG: TIR domain-containing protein [Leptospiraceae bacterium]|nr:TIR domain-containing protein [Leptospiraceae bacterium]
MPRRVFYSFHYEEDSWRASQVRNMGVVEGNKPAHDNDWEQIKRKGEASIKNWIDAQLNGCSCTVVLIGTKTAERKWVRYEIEKSWNEGKGLLGVYIHDLKNHRGERAPAGRNPFEGFQLCESGKPLSNVAKTYKPPFSSDSNYTYNYIKNNLANWIEEAIEIRNNHSEKIYEPNYF